MPAPYSCPECNRTDVQLISSKPQYRPDSLAMDASKVHPYTTMHTFKCECGMAFTHTEPIDPNPVEVP